MSFGVKYYSYTSYYKSISIHYPSNNPITIIHTSNVFNALQHHHSKNIFHW